LFVRLRFTPEVREQLLAERAERLVESRVTITAWSLVVSCAMLGVALAYLKADALADVRNAHRLRIAAMLVLTVLLIAGGLLVGYFFEVESYGGIFAAV
jgi:hypothetical protein